jgi:Protein of unknown function (DUF3822)
LKQLFYINTGNLGEDVQKVLSMRIGERHFCFAITDKTGAELYSLGYFTAEEMSGDLLSEIYSNHAEMHSSFYDVQVSYDHPGSVLVPLEYYYENAAKAYLNTMCGTTIGSYVVSEAVDEWQLFNVYTLPNDVHEWVGRIFPAYKYRHSYSLSLRIMPADPSDHILIDFTTDEFSFIIVTENKLLIAQTFPYTTPEDILYYLLKACNEFSLPRGEIQFFISGLIEKDSQLYKELYQYFMNAEFRVQAWKLPSTEGDVYPAHFFTSLNDLARCAS